MNKIERYVYDLLKTLPWLKLAVRNVYQSIFDLFPQKQEYSISPINFKEGYFFGFHDVTPFSNDNAKILANKPSIDLKMPTSDDGMKVGYFNHKDGIFKNYVELDETYSWNFHKGCRLQWLSDNEIIFNAVSDGNMISKIINIDTENVELLPFPIDTVSTKTRVASTFSYERLEKYMPGYGYIYKDEFSYIEEEVPENTGLFLLDIDSKEMDLLISLKELSKFEYVGDEFIGCSHYVTHSEFSPDGRFLSFFHRWVDDEIRRRHTKLLVYDFKEEEIIILPTGNMVSHYVWNESNEIIAYCNFQGADCHALFSIPDIENSHKVAYPTLNSDGHQSFINETHFVTDTYPDKFRMAKLYSVDIKSDEIQLIASVYSNEKFQTKTSYKHIACDLHPRVSRDGKYICFDTVKSGTRSIAVMKID